MNCSTCGVAPAGIEDSRCLNCYQVERRIDRYIQSENGRNKLLTLLFADHLRRTASGQSEAYHMGYISYKNGHWLNPYHEGTSERIQFDMGWIDAAKASDIPIL